ncbi:PA14 domain-containing protein [Paenibacillus solisilvae]|uniref:PA14 domain-containing protein n=1 Tax=Paenibacillus solisilvae TaxID=2486751 RepID=A0ABW0VZV5_9BACL
MKRSFKLTNRMLVVVMLWTSVFAAAGYFAVQQANARTTATNVFAAAGVTATANGYVSEDFAPSHAIDGNMDSGKWVYEGDSNLPTPENPYWLKIDAGSEVTVQQFVLAHAGAGGEQAQYNTKDFMIETSSDDVSWTPVVTVTGNTYGTTTHDLETPVKARYFKLDITNPGDEGPATGRYSAHIYEFQAFGFAEAPAGTVQGATGNVQGLLGEYYLGTGSGNNFAFGDYKATTVDPLINFTDLNPVLTNFTGGEDGANVRWTGQIMAPQTDDYTFYMQGDNGFRMWIDDKLVIDHWVNDWDKEQVSTPVTLEGNRKYSFKIEYFEDFGGSNLYLRWSTPTMTKDIVSSNAFFLPADYTGAAASTVAADGKSISLTMVSDMNQLTTDLHNHMIVMADALPVQVQSIEQGVDTSSMTLKLAKAILPGQRVSLSYDGQAGLQYADGTVVTSLKFNPTNLSELVNYSPIAIAMSIYGSAKTNRSFAWYTNYNRPQNAPANATDSIVEVVPASESFDSPDVKRFVGKPEETKILNNLKITNSTTGSFISHKVLVEGLTPGTAYKYRVGAENYWSQTGTFTTEGENENTFNFLYMTDSQGSNTQDYSVWANTMTQALQHVTDPKFLLMTGDQVDAGALESQWLDYFGEPQDMLMNLPIQAAVGNHEGPYNDNYYYHLNYPNNSIEDPLPPGSVYAYDYGDAHIMVLNTMDIGWDDRQKASFSHEIEWLKREVAQTDKKWKIVAFHKAIYSVGNHAIESDILALRQMLYPVFDELGIDVVLQGHDHTFMRSFQMYNNQPIKNVQKDDQDRVLNPDGTLYMINNSAATKFYDIQDGVDRFYADVFLQPKKAIYSGISMTENSFTIKSYQSGDDAPFDTYAIVRDDVKPNPVEDLTAVKTDDGKRTITWTKPQDSSDNVIRGFRIYEANGKLGPNWSVYLPVAAGQDSYQYVVENMNLDQTYNFVVKAINKRDNSDARTATSAGIQPAAPTAPVMDDAHNTFGWTNAPKYTQPTDYEFSVNNGATWKLVTANPQPVGDGDYPAGSVQVRIAANATLGIAYGMPLASTKAYTKNDVRDTFLLMGTIDRGDQIKVGVNVEQLTEYGDDAFLVFQLLKGKNPAPVLISAVPLKQTKMAITQYFNETGSDYKVKVFVVNQFDSKLTTPTQLAKPILLQ